MRKFLVVFTLFNGLVMHAQFKPSGILLNIKNANTKAVKDLSLVSIKDSNNPIELTFQTHTCIGINREDNKWYVLPLNGTSGQISANTNLWILPQDPFSKDKAYLIKLPGSDSVIAVIENDRLKVNVYSKKFELHTAEARPHSDCFNNRYTINIQGGDTLANALAGFYWGTLLPSVVEKTKAKNYPYSSGMLLAR